MRALRNEINDRLGFFVEASLGNAESDTEGGFTNIQYTCIQPDNAFIQPSQRRQFRLLEFRDG